MESADVRKRIIETIARAKREAGERRQRNAEAEAAYARFLEQAAVPTFRQVVAVLKAEGHSFIVNTPGGGVRLASERSADDFVELTLDTTGREPQVLATIRRAKGRETVAEERPLKPGVRVEHLTDRDVLDLLAEALQIFLEK